HDLLLGQAGTRLDHHEDLDRLAGTIIRHANRGTLQHTRQGGQHIFQFVRIHVEAGHQDHVLLAVDDADETVRLDDSYITGLQPAIGAEHFIGGFLALPVAFHYLRAFGTELAPLAKRQVVAFFVDHLAAGGGNRDADGADLDILNRINRDYWAGFGQAVTCTDGAASNLLPPLSRCQLQGRATGTGQLQTGKIQSAECLVVAQGDKQAIETHRGGELEVAQVPDHRRQIARVGDQYVVVTGQHHHHAVHGKG